MNVSPFGKPEQGPNFYLFDPSVRYSMHITQDGGNTDDLRLDFRFMTEIRDGSSGYYTRADGLLQQANAQAPHDPETLIGLGTLALARHDFQSGRIWGQQAIIAAPTKSAGFGVVVDAELELGQYDEVIATAQHMVDLRPDDASCSRISYLRELHGDVAGAMEMMQLAVHAGAPGAEGTEWARVQLGNLHFGRGDLDRAEAAYQEALVRLPGYVHARGGLAQIARCVGDEPRAAELLRDALTVNPYFSLEYAAEARAALGALEEGATQ